MKEEQPCENLKSPNWSDQKYAYTPYIHQCPICEGWRAFCDNCHSDHHQGGWQTCVKKPKLGDPDYVSGHSIDVNGNCNMGCC